MTTRGRLRFIRNWGRETLPVQSCRDRRASHHEQHRCGRDPVSLCLILCVLTARHPDEWSRPAGLPASTTTAAISAGTSGYSTNPIRSFPRSRPWMDVSHGLSASFQVCERTSCSVGRCRVRLVAPPYDMVPLKDSAKSKQKAAKNPVGPGVGSGTG